MALLSPGERRRVRGFIINKFRGDPALLEEGLRIIEQRTDVPVLGVLPYAGNLEIPEEDGAGLKLGSINDGGRPIKIGVIVLPRISNYTDFEPLFTEKDVSLQYFESPEHAGTLDLLCLPGSKSTIADLAWLRQQGWEDFIAAHRKAGGRVIGICGGYQMMGHRIADPEHVESDSDQAIGLGLLAIETVFAGEKVTVQTEGIHLDSGEAISGYEIHCGRVTRLGDSEMFRIGNGEDQSFFEGAVSSDGKVWGTLIHGAFDAPGFRRHFLNEIRRAKGLEPLEPRQKGAHQRRAEAYDRFARLLQTHLDISTIAKLLGIDPERLNA